LSAQVSAGLRRCREPAGRGSPWAVGGVGDPTSSGVPATPGRLPRSDGRVRNDARLPVGWRVSPVLGGSGCTAVAACFRAVPFGTASAFRLMVPRPGRLSVVAGGAAPGSGGGTAGAARPRAARARRDRGRRRVPARAPQRATVTEAAPRAARFASATGFDDTSGRPGVCTPCRRPSPRHGGASAASRAVGPVQHAPRVTGAVGRSCRGLRVFTRRPL
jgi:hypothetical protein